MEEKEEKQISDGNAFFDLFPPGYRFKPSDDELVVHYLRKKILNEPLPPNRMVEVELYKRNPQDLAVPLVLEFLEMEMLLILELKFVSLAFVVFGFKPEKIGSFPENYIPYEDNEWYFFTPRDRKYKNGERPSRSAGDGYWRATATERPVKHNGVQVGCRKGLVFYEGKFPNGNKTDWIMHEFTAGNLPRRKVSEVEADMRLDDWVLCRLYNKADKYSKGPSCSRYRRVPDQEPENEVLPQIQDRGKMPIVEESKMLPQESFFPPFEQMYSSYNQANPMGFNYSDNSPFFHGCQSGLIEGSETLYTQLGQNPMIYSMMSGYHQNPNPMLPQELFSSANIINQEQLNDYHSDDPGASTSVISTTNYDNKLKKHL
ncbi:NAC domain-containing protein 67-like [Mangifera indica]|uniref:NAC domain-containing protein 67-like n=1 Tax=Mangifera indica TaxID=29780 RepID=UPI001CFA2E4A|nr:NAC domain-containing protein 67-like [Mangifera indica]